MRVCKNGPSADDGSTNGRQVEEFRRAGIVAPSSRAREPRGERVRFTLQKRNAFATTIGAFNDFEDWFEHVFQEHLR
jgi:hypothetical protein